MLLILFSQQLACGGQTKVDNSRPALMVKQNVGWLQIAMHQPVGMQVGHCIGDLNEQFEETRLARTLTHLQESGERIAAIELHLNVEIER